MAFDRTPFIALIDRDEDGEDLTPDERSSLDYYYAAINVAEGLPVAGAPREWCAMVDRIERHRLGNPLPAELSEWIDAQDTEDLNSYQRDRLRSLPRWYVSHL